MKQFAIHRVGDLLTGPAYLPKKDGLEGIFAEADEALPIRRRESFEQKICAAILWQAVKDFIGGERDMCHRRDVRSAKAWLFHEAGQEPFTLATVCAVLGTHPDSVRRLLYQRISTMYCGEEAPIAGHRPRRNL